MDESLETSGPRRVGPALEAAYQFLLWLIPCVDRFPRARKFTLGDRIERMALDLVAALVAATYTRQRQALLADANLILDQLRLLIRLAKDLRCIDLKRYEHAARSIDEVGRLVGGWRRAGYGEAG